MAGKNRRSSPAVETDGSPDKKDSIKAELFQHGHAFSFLQVMRLLYLMERASDQPAASTDREHRCVKIRPNLSLGFPAADIAAIEEKTDKDRTLFQVTANFLGLYGVSSPLPTFYTEDLIDEDQDDRTITRDFLDIINQRLYELLFKCMTKYRQSIQVIEEKNPNHIQKLFSLLGFGEDVLRDDIPDAYALFRYIGLFTQFPRSAMGLKVLLQDAMGKVPVVIEPCISRKVRITDDQRISLGVHGGILGRDAFLGEEIEDRIGKFRLKVGPMTKSDFRQCFPGKEKYKKLVLLTNLYINEPLDYDIELIMKKGQKQTTSLGGSEWSGLGVDTWIFSGEDEWESRSIVYPDS